MDARLAPPRSEKKVLCKTCGAQWGKIDFNPLKFGRQGRKDPNYFLGISFLNTQVSLTPTTNTYPGQSVRPYYGLKVRRP